MHRMWRLVTRNWSASLGRTSASILSVALGVSAVVVITSFYETARRVIERDVVTHWLGSAHLTVHPLGAHWGSLDAALAEPIRGLENIAQVASRLKRRVSFIAYDAEQDRVVSRWRVDAIGIDAAGEPPLHTPTGLTGRMVESGRRGMAVIERPMADLWGTYIGQPIILSSRAREREQQLTVVGLFDSERIADFQSPFVYVSLTDLQELVGEPGAATAIDILLVDHSPEALANAQAAVEDLIERRGLSYKCKVESSAGRQMVLDEADRLTRLSLMLIAFVALLTSFFIILTTMSMSLFERRRVLGILRCVGTTRRQMAGMLYLELIPVGVVGTLLGVAVGVGLTRLVEYWNNKIAIAGGMPGVPLVLSPWGIKLAVISGMVTALISASALVFQVCRVTPLSAVNPDARPPRMLYLYASGVLGLLLLAVHELAVSVEDASRWLDPVFLGMGMCSLYLGYVLVAPSIVVWLGPLIARLVGPLLGLRGRLAEDQFGRAPWRSAGVCWVLMVGLSLIVYIGIGAESVMAVWNFPGRLPEAFVWTREFASGEALEQVRRIPGLRSVTAAVDVDCKIHVRGPENKSLADSLAEKFLHKLTRPVFVAGDPEQFLDMVKVTFDEGSREDALNKLQRGGYVLIPTQTARNKGLHLADRVTVEIKGRSADFEVAGVVQAPVLDLAVTAFQATSYLELAAANTFIGTRADLVDKFGLDVVSSVMCDLDLPTTEPPDVFCQPRPPRDGPDWVELVPRISDRLPKERDVTERILPVLRSWVDAGSEGPFPAVAGHSVDVGAEFDRYSRAFRRVTWSWRRDSPEERWAIFREQLVLGRVVQTLGHPNAIRGSMRRLRDLADRHVRRGAMVLTWLPSILLVVAAVGVGNLMMVSVQIRSRQIAVLRAVGALRSQIVRLVLAESISLGLLGSVMGVALGLHEAYSDNRLSYALIGFKPPFTIPVSTLALGIALTLSVCLIAGIIPARHAARSNVIEAMQTT